MALDSIQIALVYVLFGYPLGAIVLKSALQTRWARQLYERYGAVYPYGFIRRRIGSRHYRPPGSKRGRTLHPALRSDLDRVQRRSLFWDLSLGAIWAAEVAAWLILKRAGF
ncbi:MAG TPA: hypothetical protein VGF29_18075 [Hyphomicrobiaceae bacterium]|jgi:hypothetical protein